jgi:hypothetical protein
MGLLGQMQGEEGRDDEELGQACPRADETNDCAEDQENADQRKRRAQEFREQDAPDRGQGHADQRLPGGIEKLHRDVARESLGKHNRMRGRRLTIYPAQRSSGGAKRLLHPR